MGVRVFIGREAGYGCELPEQACLMCSTTDTVFGPLMSLNLDTEPLFDNVADYANAFIVWLHNDAREYGEHELEGKVAQFMRHLRTLQRCEVCKNKHAPKSEPVCDSCKEDCDDLLG